MSRHPTRGQIRIIEAVIASAIIIGSLGIYSVLLVPSIKLEAQALEQTANESLISIASNGSLAVIINGTEGSTRIGEIQQLIGSRLPRGYLFTATFFNVSGTTDFGLTEWFTVTNSDQTSHDVTVTYDFMTTQRDTDPGEDEVFKVVHQIRIILGLSEAG